MRHAVVAVLLPLAACDPSPNCNVGLNSPYYATMCKGELDYPLPVLYRTSAFPPRAGETVTFDYLVLGPEPVSLSAETCRWGHVQGDPSSGGWPCDRRALRAPWAELSTNGGTLTGTLPMPPAAVPEVCADTLAWNRFDTVIQEPPRGCSTYNAARLTVDDGHRAVPLNFVVDAVRGPIPSGLTSLDAAPWSVYAAETSDGTFVVEAELELPADTLRYADPSRWEHGVVGRVAMLVLTPERGEVLEPSPSVQVEPDGAFVRTRVVLAEAPTEPLRFRLHAYADRGFPRGENISRVIELRREGADWSVRSVLPAE